MPRRYHRPPAVKRRKARRPGSPDSYEAPAELEGGVSTDVASDDVTDDDWDEGPEVEDSTSTPAVSAASQQGSRESVRHIQRDYSYVRSELTRIVVLAAIIVAGLGVVAIIR